MKEEKWKEISSPDNYGYSIYISNMGNIRKILNSGIEKYIPIKLAPHGYYRCCFYGGRYYIHRLVAEYFLLDYDPQKQVNHKDGDKTNNRVDNLECISAKENMQHASKIGKLYRHRHNNKIKKVPIIGINLLKHEIKFFKTSREASLYVGGDKRANGVSQCTLSNYKTYKNWAFCRIDKYEAQELINQLKEVV